MRQAPYLIAQLGMINGNMDQYISKITEGRSVTDDYNEAIQSWASELKIARNSVLKINSVYAEFLDTVGVLGLKVFNGAVKGLSDLAERSGKLGVALQTVADVAITAGIALASLKVTQLSSSFLGLTANAKAFAAIAESQSIAAAIGSLISPVGAILAIFAGIAAIGVGIYSYQKRITEQAELEESIRKRKLAELEKEIDLMKMQSDLLETQANMYKELSENRLSDNWQDNYNIISETTSKLKDMSNLLSLTEKIKVFNLPELKTSRIVFEEINNSYNKKIESIKREHELSNEALADENKRHSKEMSNLQDKLDKELMTGKRIWESDEDVAKRRSKIRDKLAKEEQIHQQNRIDAIGKDYKYFEAMNLKKKKLYEEGVFGAMGKQEALDEFGYENLFDFLTQGDIKKVQEYVENSNSASETQSAMIQILKDRYKIETENLEKVNKKIEEYRNYLGQINEINTSLRVDMFNKIIKAEDIKDITEYTDKMKEMGIFGGTETEDSLKALEKAMTDFGVKTTAQQLLDEGEFLKVAATFDAITKHIDGANLAIERLKGMKASDNLIEDAKKERDTWLETKKIFLGLIDVQDKVAIKSSFYYDMTKKFALELQQVGLKELDLLNNKKALLEEETNISKAKYEFDKKSIEEDIKASKKAEDIAKLKVKYGDLEAKRLEEINKEKKKGLEYDLDEQEIYEKRAKTFDDYIGKFKDLIKSEKTIADLRKQSEGLTKQQAEAEIMTITKQLEANKGRGGRADTKDLDARLKIYQDILKAIGLIKTEEEKIAEIQHKKDTLYMSTLDTLREELSLLESKTGLDKESAEYAQWELDIAMKNKAIALEENKILMDRVGILSDLAGMFGGEGVGGAVSGIGGLFQEDSKTGLNAFGTMAGGGAEGLFAGLGIGMTAFSVADAIWNHNKAKQEENRQKRIEFMDKERNKILKSQSEVFTNTLSGLSYKNLDEAFTSAIKNFGQSEFQTKISKPEDVSWGNIFKSPENQKGGFDFSLEGVRTSEDLNALKDRFNEVEIIATKSSYIVKNLTDEQKDQIKTLADLRAFEDARDYINDLSNLYEENKGEMFSTIFGFDLRAVTDDDDKIVDYVTAGWSKSESIIEKIQSDALEGLNEINSYLGSDFVNSVSSALISNNEEIENSIGYIEKGYSQLSEDIRKGVEQGATLEDIFSGEAYINLERIVTQTKALEAEQEKVNEDVKYLQDLWINAGGAIADASDLLSDMDKSILDTLAEGLLSKDAESMFASFGELLSSSIQEELRDSDVINKPFMFMKDNLEKALESGDVETFTKFYEKINVSAENLNAESLRTLGMSSEQIEKLKTWQEIYEVINKLEQDSLNIFERRDKLLQDAETTYKKILDIHKVDLESMTNYAESYRSVKKSLEEAKTLTNQISTNSNEFLTNWINGGNKMSDVMSMMTDDIQGLYNSTLEFLDADNYTDASTKLGEDMASGLMESYQKELMNEKYGQNFLELNRKRMQALSSGSLGDIQALNNEIQKFAVQSEAERLKFGAMKDLFSADSNIAYNQADSNITYETGSTKSNIYNYYNDVSIEGMFIADKTSMKKLGNEIVKVLPESMKNNNIR